MFAKETYIGRRAELRRRLASSGGIILIPGNGEAPANYPNNAFGFRQDSTFLYYFGLNHPDFFGVIDTDGDDILYGNDFTVDDIIWMGPQPTVAELGASVGVQKTAPLSALGEKVREAVRLGRPVHFLPPYRGEVKLQLSSLLGISPEALTDYMSVELILAVAEMREVKSAEEIEALERAFEIGYRMHTTAMKMCRPGVGEREIAGAISGIALQYGSGVSFHSIVSQHGETLHNHNHDGILESGRLLLVDAGGEALDNYCSDHTRTMPVSGKFSPRQRDVYEIVLAAHDKVAETVGPDMKYQDVHNFCCKVLAEGLVSLGLMKGSAEEAVAAGAMGLFMPHGLGHGMGLDVHDCEAFGERSFSDFSRVMKRAGEINCCITRGCWVLRPGTVMSDEPGIYFIPALIEKWRREGRCTDFIAYDKLEAWYDFGGIRIEDDIIITESGRKVVGDKRIPSGVAEIEEFMLSAR